MVLLEVERLSRNFGGLQAVDEVSFCVADGSIKAIIGPNGAGKTTIFNLISGSLKPSTGVICYRNQEITGARPHQIAQHGILRTFQNIKLCGHMTVFENVMLGRHTRSKAGFLSSMLSLPWTRREEKSIEEHALSVLETLSITEVMNEEVSNLPFGTQRTVELGRALAAEPELMLLDEPASGLNIYETQSLAQIITRIREAGVTILLVEHDMSLVMDISDEIVVLNYGKKIAEGAPREVQQNREVISSYLGEDHVTS